jgi:3-oxoacyl-[acyl-carrier protein] reductase
METGIAGRRALVLGASKGIGFGIAQAFADDGVNVALTSRQLDAANAAAERIGHGARGFACDTGDLAQVDALFHDVTKALGSIDILVLNSGGPTPGSARNVAPDVWRRYFDSMFVNLVRLADHCLPGMIERRFGRIISVISSGVIEPIPNLAISNSIRPALVGWGKTLAGEVAKDGITVNAIAPGRILTDRLTDLDQANAKRTGKTIEEMRASAQARIPAGRYGTIEEFGAAALFLASAGAGFVTGSVIRVDGGQIASTH